MAKRISDHQIEIARSAFRNGRSIPECCSIASMSRASFNKYLGSEVQTYIDEHTASKARREQQSRINEIMPTPTVVGKPAEEDTIIDDDDDFIRLIEYEFRECADHIEARDVYDHYKPQAVINLKRTEALRRLYESALNQTVRGEPLKSPQVAADIEQLSSDQHRRTIQNFKSRFNLKKCPIPRKSTVADWTEARLLEHLMFWYVHHHKGHKEAMEAIQGMTLEQYRCWFDEL